MNRTYDPADEIIRAWLQEPVTPPESGLARVVELVPETPQQRHWWPTYPTRRSQAMFSASRIVVGGALFAIVGSTLLINSGLTPTEMGPMPPAASSVSPTVPATHPSASPAGSAIDWSTPSVSFTAERLAIKAGDLTLTGAISPSLSDFTAIPDYRELKARWTEEGRDIVLTIDMDADATHWWIDNITTEGGLQDGDEVIYDRLHRLTRTRLGETLETDLALTPTKASRPAAKDGAGLRIDGLRLTAFGPETNAAPLEASGCVPLSEQDAAILPYGEAQVLDYFADGALLAGIDELPIVEADARLTELGICHEFQYTYDLLGSTEGGGGRASERWCELPPVVRLREVDPGAREPKVDPLLEHVDHFPYAVTPERSVVIVVDDLEPREPRTQPPAGWGCPTV